MHRLNINLILLHVYLKILQKCDSQQVLYNPEVLPHNTWGCNSGTNPNGVGHLGPGDHQIIVSSTFFHFFYTDLHYHLARAYRITK